MEKIDLKKAGYRFNGQPMEEVTLFDNGSFSVVLKNKETRVCHLFDENGAEFLPKQQDFVCGAVMSDGYYLLKQKGRGSYTLYNTKHEPVVEKIDDFLLFANGWYELRVGEYRRLFNAEHQQVAKGYRQCQVFNVGYCVDKEGDGEVWRLCLPNGHFFATATGVVSFLGDGNRLQESAGGNTYDVLGFDGHLVVADVSPSVQKFPNGKFAVQFADDGSRKMFEADGEPLSPRVVASSEFLPDGRFVSYKNPGHRIVGLYDQRGYIAMSGLWDMQQMGDYYLLEAENVNNRLVNDNGEVIGEGYFPVRVSGSFALFEREGSELVLFNRKGKVFSSDCQ